MDDPSYDWLGDFYSSHVNPVFWKLHGWVDDRIGAWKQAHEITGEYHWKGTWSGKMVMGSHQAMHDHLMTAALGNPPPELEAHLAETDELVRASAGFAQLASPM